jgi:antirestriction protein ArdC
MSLSQPDPTPSGPNSIDAPKTPKAPKAPKKATRLSSGGDDSSRARDLAKQREMDKARGASATNPVGKEAVEQAKKLERERAAARQSETRLSSGRVIMSDGQMEISFDEEDGDGIYDATRDGFRIIRNERGSGGGRRFPESTATYGGSGLSEAEKKEILDVVKDSSNPLVQKILKGSFPSSLSDKQWAVLKREFEKNKKKTPSGYISNVRSGGTVAPGAKLDGGIAYLEPDHANDKDYENLRDAIQTAMRSNQMLRFDYSGKNREVIPVKIEKNNKTGKWNLTAQDDTGARKLFSLDKITPSSAERLSSGEWTKTDDGIEMDAPDIDGGYLIQGNSKDGFVVTRFADARRNGGQNANEYEHDKVFTSSSAAKKWAERNYKLISEEIGKEDVEIRKADAERSADFADMTPEDAADYAAWMDEETWRDRDPRFSSGEGYWVDAAEKEAGNDPKKLADFLIEQGILEEDHPRVKKLRNRLTADDEFEKTFSMLAEMDAEAEAESRAERRSTQFTAVENPFGRLSSGQRTWIDAAEDEAGDDPRELADFLLARGVIDEEDHPIIKGLRDGRTADDELEKAYEMLAEMDAEDQAEHAAQFKNAASEVSSLTKPTMPDLDGMDEDEAGDALQQANDEILSFADGTENIAREYLGDAEYNKRFGGAVPLIEEMSKNHDGGNYEREIALENALERANGFNLSVAGEMELESNRFSSGIDFDKKGASGLREMRHVERNPLRMDSSAEKAERDAYEKDVAAFIKNNGWFVEVPMYNGDPKWQSEDWYRAREFATNVAKLRFEDNYQNETNQFMQFFDKPGKPSKKDFFAKKGTVDYKSWYMAHTPLLTSEIDSVLNSDLYSDNYKESYMNAIRSFLYVNRPEFGPYGGDDPAYQAWLQQSGLGYGGRYSTSGPKFDEMGRFSSGAKRGSRKDNYINSYENPEDLKEAIFSELIFAGDYEGMTAEDLAYALNVRAESVEPILEQVKKDVGDAREDYDRYLESQPEMTDEDLQAMADDYARAQTVTDKFNNMTPEEAADYAAWMDEETWRDRDPRFSSGRELTDEEKQELGAQFARAQDRRKAELEERGAQFARAQDRRKAKEDRITKFYREMAEQNAMLSEMTPSELADYAEQWNESHAEDSRLSSGGINYYDWMVENGVPRSALDGERFRGRDAYGHSFHDYYAEDAFANIDEAVVEALLSDRTQRTSIQDLAKEAREHGLQLATNRSMQEEFSWAEAVNPKPESLRAEDLVRRPDDLGSNARRVAEAVANNSNGARSAASREDILHFTYDGKQRSVYPESFGTSKKGIAFFRAWDETADDGNGAYRSFNIDKIEGLVSHAIPPYVEIGTMTPEPKWSIADFSIEDWAKINDRFYFRSSEVGRAAFDIETAIQWELEGTGTRAPGSIIDTAERELKRLKQIAFDKHITEMVEKGATSSKFSLDIENAKRYGVKPLNRGNRLSSGGSGRFNIAEARSFDDMSDREQLAVFNGIKDRLSENNPSMVSVLEDGGLNIDGYLADFPQLHPDFSSEESGGERFSSGGFAPPKPKRAARKDEEGLIDGARVMRGNTFIESVVGQYERNRGKLSDAQWAKLAEIVGRGSKPTSAGAPTPKRPSKGPRLEKYSGKPRKIIGIDEVVPYDYPEAEFKPNPEQADAIDAMMTGSDVKVGALAATGKTTTVISFANRLAAQDPSARVLYLVFNRDAKSDAEARGMGDNVSVMTMDGIAFKAMIGAGGSPGLRPGLKTKLYEAGKASMDDSVRSYVGKAAYLGIKGAFIPRDGDAPLELTPTDIYKIVAKGVNAYSISSDEKIGPQHFTGKFNGPLAIPEDSPIMPNVLKYANKMWEDLQQDRDNLKKQGMLGLESNHLTKMWALTKPDVASFGGTDGVNVIMVDEAQDINPVFAKMMKDSKSAQKIYIGDTNQAINAWRGADGSTLDAVEAEYDMPITESYRFGAKIAGIGNRFLTLLGVKERMTGKKTRAGKNGSRVDVPGEVVTEMSVLDATMILCRSNGGAIAATMEVIEEGGGQKKVYGSANFKKDLQNFIDNIEWMQNAEKGEPYWTNSRGERMTSRPEFSADLEGITTYEEFKKEVASADNNRLNMLDGLLEKNSIPGLRNALDNILTRKEDIEKLDPNDYVKIQTAHTSKGLESGKVKIWSDFRKPKFDEELEEWVMPNEQELRLSYVAVTRAEEEIDLGSLDWVFNHTTDADEKPNARSARLSSGRSIARRQGKGKNSRARGQRPWSDEDRQNFADGNRLRAQTIPGKRREGPAAAEFSSGERLSAGGSGFYLDNPPDDDSDKWIDMASDDYRSISDSWRDFPEETDEFLSDFWSSHETWGQNPPSPWEFTAENLSEITDIFENTQRPSAYEPYYKQLRDLEGLPKEDIIKALKQIREDDDDTQMFVEFFNKDVFEVAEEKEAPLGKYVLEALQEWNNLPKWLENSQTDDGYTRPYRFYSGARFAPDGESGSRIQRRLSSGEYFGPPPTGSGKYNSREQVRASLDAFHSDPGTAVIPSDMLGILGSVPKGKESHILNAEVAKKIIANPDMEYSSNNGWPVDAGRLLDFIEVNEEDAIRTLREIGDAQRISSILGIPEKDAQDMLDGKPVYIMAGTAADMLDDLKEGKHYLEAGQLGNEDVTRIWGFDGAPKWVRHSDIATPEYDLDEQGRVNWSKEKWDSLSREQFDAELARGKNPPEPVYESPVERFNSEAIFDNPKWNARSGSFRNPVVDSEFAVAPRAARRSEQLEPTRAPSQARVGEKTVMADKEFAAKWIKRGHSVTASNMMDILGVERDSKNPEPSTEELNRLIEAMNEVSAKVGLTPLSVTRAPTKSDLKKLGISDEFMHALVASGKFKNMKEAMASLGDSRFDSLAAEYDSRMLSDAALLRIKDKMNKEGVPNSVAVLIEAITASFGRKQAWEKRIKEGRVSIKGDMKEDGMISDAKLSELLGRVNDALARSGYPEISQDELFPKDETGGYVDNLSSAVPGAPRMSSGQRFVARTSSSRRADAMNDAAARREGNTSRLSSGESLPFKDENGKLVPSNISQAAKDATPANPGFDREPLIQRKTPHRNLEDVEKALKTRQAISELFTMNRKNTQGFSVYDYQDELVKAGFPLEEIEEMIDSFVRLDSYIDDVERHFEIAREKLDETLEEIEDNLSKIERLKGERADAIKKWGNTEDNYWVQAIDDKIAAAMIKIDKAYQGGIGGEDGRLGTLHPQLEEMMSAMPGWTEGPYGMGDDINRRLLKVEASISKAGGKKKAVPVTGIDFGVPEGTRLSSGKAEEYYQNLTSHLINMIEKSQKDGGKWEAPWHKAGNMPRNASTKNMYSGGNLFALMLAAEEKGYATPHWGGFQQWKKLGGSVKKGEKATAILMPKTMFGDEIDPDTGKKVRKSKGIYFTTAHVFNLDQVEGIDREEFLKLPTDALTPEQRVGKLEDAIKEIGATINTGDGSRAYYSPREDHVVMPPFELFKTPEGYYGTLAHELVHWTGHSSRLDRKNMNQFGSPEYAREELIAEFGSAFLLAMFGLSAEPREDHAHYLANWLQVLRDEPNALQEASTKAQEASKMLITKMKIVLEEMGEIASDAESAAEEAVDVKSLQVFNDPLYEFKDASIEWSKDPLHAPFLIKSLDDEKHSSGLVNRSWERIAETAIFLERLSRNK